VVGGGGEGGDGGGGEGGGGRGGVGGRGCVRGGRGEEKDWAGVSTMVWRVITVWRTGSQPPVIILTTQLNIVIIILQRS